MSDNIQIFSSPHKIATKDTVDGVNCQVNGEEFHLPGKVKDYEIETKGQVTYIEVKKNQSKSLLSTTNMDIKKFEDQIAPLDKDIKDKKDKDGKKASKSQDSKRKLADFKTVRDILRDGKQGNHKIQPSQMKRNTAAKKGAEAKENKDVMDKDELNPIVRKFTDDHYWKSFKNKDVLSFDLKNDEDKKGLQKILKTAEKSILPDFQQIAIWGIEEEDLTNVAKLLRNSFPKKVEELHLGSAEYLELEKLVSAIEKCAPSVTDEIKFSKFEIGKKNFEKVFNSFSHVNRAQFTSCTIASEGVKFDNKKKWKITEICMKNVGSEEESDWVENEDNLKDFLSAISKTSLKDSLETFETYDNGLDFDEIEEAFVDNDLDEVEVVEGDRPSQN